MHIVLTSGEIYRRKDFEFFWTAEKVGKRVIALAGREQLPAGAPPTLHAYEDLIADQQMVITITHTGYIKSLPLATYRHDLSIMLRAARERRIPLVVGSVLTSGANAPLRIGVDIIRDIAQIHRRAVPVGDGDAAVLLG